MGLVKWSLLPGCFLPFPFLLQAQVSLVCTSSKAWEATIFSSGSPLLLCLKGVALTGLLDMFLCLHSHLQGQKKWSCIRLSILSRSKWALTYHDTLTEWSPNAWAKPLGIGPPGLLLAGFFYNRMPYLSLRWLHSQRSCQSSGLDWQSLSEHWPRSSPASSQSHETQDRVCLLGLMPIISGHAGDLQTIPYRVPGCTCHSCVPLWGL